MMKTKRLLMCISLLFLAIGAPLLAQEAQQPALCSLVTLFDAWSPATVPGAPNGVVYGLLINLSSQPDTLLGASTDAAEAVELHQSGVDASGMMQMSPVEGGITVAANGFSELQMGGLHMMLINLVQALQEGSTLPLTLHFEHAGDVQIMVPVKALSAQGEGMSSSDMPAATQDASMEADTGIEMAASEPLLVPAECQTVVFLGAYARATIPGAANSAAYGLLLNLGDTSETLVSAHTDAAQSTELHNTTIDASGVMAMTPLPDGIELPPLSAVQLKRGGMHVMLIGLTHDLAAGDTLSLNLTFDNGSSMALTVPVVALQTDSVGKM